MYFQTQHQLWLESILGWAIHLGHVLPFSRLGAKLWVGKKSGDRYRIERKVWGRGRWEEGGGGGGGQGAGGAELHKIIFFRYPILIYLKCSIKVRKFLMYEFATARANFHYVYKIDYFLTHFPIGEKSTMSLYFKFLSICFFDSLFFLWQKLCWGQKIFLRRKLFFCDTSGFLRQKFKQKLVSVMETCFLK